MNQPGSDRLIASATHQRGREEKKRTVNAAGQLEAGALRLQRTAGNQAVSGLLGDASAADLVGDTVAGAGRPLDAALQREMQSTLGRDFSGVRVHDDSKAAASAQAVGARAYTTGSHVVFAEGEYQPGSQTGKKLIAHELTHVAQQASGPVDGTDSGDGLSVSSPADRFERQADAVAQDYSLSG